MGRAAVYRALADDAQLAELCQGGVYDNYTLESSPTRAAQFIVTRWGAGFRTRDLEVYVNRPTELGPDMTALDRAVQRVKEIISAMEHASGSDGYTVTATRYVGIGRDGYDPGYETWVRSIEFTILSRNT